MEFNFYVYIDPLDGSDMKKGIVFTGDLQECIDKFYELYMDMEYCYLAIGIEYGINDVDIFYDGVNSLSESKFYKYYESIDAKIVEYAITVIKNRFNLGGV